MHGLVFALLMMLTAVLEGITTVSVPQQNPWDVIRHQVSNQETEIRTFEHRLENLQVILDALREQMHTSSLTHKDQIKGSTGALEQKLGMLENIAKSLSADLQQLKIHANETTHALDLYKKTLLEYDQRFKLQAQNIDHLSSALGTILDALQLKGEVAINEPGEKQYKIKSGDRLDKIAKANGTTVKEIMLLNNMSSDKIVEGKTIKIP